MRGKFIHFRINPRSQEYNLLSLLRFQNTGIFDFMTENVFEDFSLEIRDAILATDLAVYFRTRAKLIQVWHENNFDWHSTNHRNLLKSIMMTSSDLCGTCKPYSQAKTICSNLYSKYSQFLDEYTVHNHVQVFLNYELLRGKNNR